MNYTEPGFLFIGFILPSLFALTLIAEGAWNLYQRTAGGLSIILGVGFMALIIGVYFFLLQ